MCDWGGGGVQSVSTPACTGLSPPLRLPLHLPLHYPLSPSVRRFFGQRTLGDLEKHVMVTTFNLSATNNRLTAGTHWHPTLLTTLPRCNGRVRARDTNRLRLTSVHGPSLQCTTLTSHASCQGRVSRTFVTALCLLRCRRCTCCYRLTQTPQYSPRMPPCARQRHQHTSR